MESEVCPNVLKHRLTCTHLLSVLQLEVEEREDNDAASGLGIEGPLGRGLLALLLVVTC